MNPAVSGGCPLNRSNSKKGFTLLEVLLALLILAVAMSALQIKTMQHMEGSRYLKEKTLAHWVAMNRMALLQIENRRSNALLQEQTSGVSTMAGRTWYWYVRPQDPLENMAVQPVEISVSTSPDHAQAVVVLRGVLDGYHAM